MKASSCGTVKGLNPDAILHWLGDWTHYSTLMSFFFLIIFIYLGSREIEIETKEKKFLTLPVHCSSAHSGYCWTGLESGARSQELTPGHLRQRPKT